jgi:hypothetical protein
MKMPSHARLLCALALPALALLASACVPPAQVFVSPAYPPAHIQKVALLPFSDYPPMAGSGLLVEGVFGNLLLKDYSLADSSTVGAALQQASLQPGQPMDLDTLQALAAKLGVDAFVEGQVTDFSDASDQTEVEDVPIEQDTPIYTQVESTGRSGRVHARTIITGTNFSTVDEPEEETVSIPAHVGLSVRMVDAKTGDVLWSASVSEQGDYLNDAAQSAATAILKGLQAAMK